MPYINQLDRTALNDKVIYAGRSIQNPGELNYLITKIIQDYVHDHGKSYSVINEIVGVLECAKLEFYRRLAAPYEDKKIEENGDVYHAD